MEMVTVYERIPILFWLTMIFSFLSILPMFVWVYAALFESLYCRFKLFKTHLVPEDVDNKSTADIQNDHGEPRNVQLAVNSQNRDTDDPHDNHGSRACGS